MTRIHLLPAYGDDRHGYGSKRPEKYKLLNSADFAGSVDVDEMALKGFLEEAMFLAEYEHVNILTTLGVMWKAGDRPYVVLPYMAKGDLCKLLQKQDLVS